MCTGIRFSDGEGNMYLARNLDWSTRYGERVVVTPAGFPLPYSFLDDAPAAHAVIGMAVVLDNYPLYFDCGNDAGLGVAGLNFPGFAEYSKGPIDGKTNIAAYEFPVWVAANFASVDEVEAALANANIVAKPVSDQLGVSMLHWIVGDGTRSIVIEQMADGLHVMDNPVDTLANQPEFTWHMTNLRTYITATGDFPAAATWGRAEITTFGAGAGAPSIPGDLLPSRFVKAAFLNANYPQKGQRMGKRAARVPYAWKRGDGGRLGGDGRRRLRAHSTDASPRARRRITTRPTTTPPSKASRLPIAMRATWANSSLLNSARGGAPPRALSYSNGERSWLISQLNRCSPLPHRRVCPSAHMVFATIASGVMSAPRKMPG